MLIYVVDPHSSISFLKICLDVFVRAQRGQLSASFDEDAAGAAWKSKSPLPSPRRPSGGGNQQDFAQKNMVPSGMMVSHG